MRVFDLFIEAKNRNYAAIMELINQLTPKIDGQAVEEVSLTEKEIRAVLRAKGLFSDNLEKALFNKHSISTYNLNILVEHHDRKGYYKLSGSSRSTLSPRLPILPFTVELIWLKSLLSDPKIKLFLAEETINKLTAFLEGYPDIITYDSLIVKNRWNNDSLIIEQIENNFKLILQAIDTRKALVFSNLTRVNRLFQGQKHLPYKIEYSVKDDYFYLISYCLDTNRTVKSLLHKIQDIQFVEYDGQVESIYREIEVDLARRKVKEPIILELRKERNTLERACYLFSCFEKDVNYLQEKKFYQMAIYYRDFEEGEIISRIFSLGKMAIVKSPVRIRQEIIGRIKKALAKY